MQANEKKTEIGKFPLRLMPSVKREAEEFSRQEGVSLNQFINVAVAEKLSRLQHERWLASRPEPDAARAARALAILGRDDGTAPDPGDEIPEGCVSSRLSLEQKRLLGNR